MPVRKQDPPSCLNLPAGGEAALLSDGDVMGLCLKWARRAGRKRHWVFFYPALLNVSVLSTLLKQGVGVTSTLATGDVE